MLTKSGGKKLLTGIFQFLWSELKTMSFGRIKSYYNMTFGYLVMRYFKRKKIKQKKLINEQNKALREGTSNYLKS